MKNYLLHFGCIGLLLGSSLVAQAQIAPYPLDAIPMPAALRVALDTVAVRGTTRLLRLAPDTGEDIPLRPMSPGHKVAVFYAPPSRDHEYDLKAVRLLVSDQGNLSRTGQLLLTFVLPDSVTHAPSVRALLPAPLLLTDREVRRSKEGVFVFDVAAYHLTMPVGGFFIVAEGIPEPPFVYMGDTAIRTSKKMPPSMHAKLRRPTGSGTRQKVVNVCDFISLRDVRTATEPQTWDFSQPRNAWKKRQLVYEKCPHCVISNTGMELVVREL